jgi:deazaflavin-dependent oxidoreductase (nitroreductase family)
MPAVRRSPLIELMWSMHRSLYQASGGRLGARLLGSLYLLLSVRGRKTGAERTVALNYFLDGETMFVVASNAGEPRHPAWYLNLMAAASGRVRAGRRRLTVRPRLAEGEERARLWSIATRADRAYAEYQSRTDRLIPVVVLEREAEAQR